MNLGAWPEGVPYEPAGGITSLELEAIISGAGSRWPAVILAADAAGRHTGWAVRAAVAIAGAWAATGRRVVLADVCLEAPELHIHLNAVNAEGVADIVLFGASLHAAVQPGGERGFDFLPPGPYAPDPASIYRDDCWARILGQLEREGAILVAYAPLEAEGLDHLVSRVGQAIVLVADPGAAGADSLLPAAAVQLVLHPATPAPAALPPEDDADEPGAARRPPPDPEDEPAHLQRSSDAEFERIRLPKEGAREQLIAELRQRQRAALLVPPPGEADAGADAGPTGAGAPPPPRSSTPGNGGLDVSIVPADAADEAAPVDPARAPLHMARSAGAAPPTEPDFAVVQPGARSRISPTVIAVSLAVVLLLAMLAGVWHYWSGRTMAADARDSAAAEASGARAPLRFSVAIEAHQDLPSGEARASAMRAAEQRFGFYITPILVDGTLYYRVMAGPMADSVSAARAMDALIEGGHKTAASEWDIRATPLAFLLGEYDTAAEAQARVDELMTLAIPAYVVAIGEGTGLMHRVYGGGYAGPTEAAIMRELLQIAGQPDSLVERMGRSSR